MTNARKLLICSLLAGVTCPIAGLMSRKAPPSLPGVAAETELLHMIRAGEQKMYPGCVSQGTTCSYSNTCATSDDGSGCVNTDACGSCSGGTNAACTGDLNATVCVTDTITCCTLSKNCQLTGTGCNCLKSAANIDIDNQSFCSGG